LKAKKHLGQHFLRDKAVISHILEVIEKECGAEVPILEVGPGPGVLTNSLVKSFPHFKAVEFDRDMVKLLIQSIDPKNIINEDFLGLDLDGVFKGQEFNLVGNFPYNISSQIVFKMLDNLDLIPVMVGMFQKEVAERICADPGSKKNGIISLRAQAYYRAEKIFDISPDAFDPPPRVDSSIIVLRRKEDSSLGCDEKIYARAIKMSFQQRRKKIRNTLKGMLKNLDDPIFQKRPEELSVEDFVNIAIEIQNQNK